jgi:hypothetical protein
MKSNVVGASRRATGSGSAIARFFGASSPKTIWAKVARTNATVRAMPKRADSGTPAAPSAGSSRSAITGSATNPSTSDVTVMPSCAPDSMKLSRPCTATARLARRSPSSAASTKRDRREATKENSAATK